MLTAVKEIRSSLCHDRNSLPGCSPPPRSPGVRTAREAEADWFMRPVAPDADIVTAAPLNFKRRLVGRCVRTAIEYKEVGRPSRNGQEVGRGERPYPSPALVGRPMLKG